jgi:hypothetical protein
MLVRANTVKPLCVQVMIFIWANSLARCIAASMVRSRSKAIAAGFASSLSAP